MNTQDFLTKIYSAFNGAIVSDVPRPTVKLVTTLNYDNAGGFDYEVDLTIYHNYRALGYAKSLDDAIDAALIDLKEKLKLAVDGDSKSAAIFCEKVLSGL
jgi:hypothetical protein